MAYNSSIARPEPAAYPTWVASLVPALPKARVVLLLLLVSVPVIAFDPGDGFDGFFWLKVRLMLGLAVLLGAWWTVALLSREITLERPTFLMVAGFGLLAWATASTMVSSDPGVGVWGFPGRDDGLLVLGVNLLAFATATTLVAGKHQQLLYRVVVVVGLVVSLIAVAQHFGFDVTGLPDSLTSARSTGTFRNPLSLAGLLTMVIPLAWVAAFQVRGRFARLAAALGLAVMLAALGCTYGRGGWLATGLAVASFILWLILRARPLIPRALLVLGVAVAAAALILVLPRPAVTGAQVHSIRQDAAQAVSPENPRNQGRLAIWAISLRMIGDHPLLGVGPDQMGEQFAPYRTAAFDSAEGAAVTADRAHSEPLNLAVTLGIPGAVAAMTLVLVALAAGVASGLRLPVSPPLLWQAALACGLIGYVAQSLVSITVPGIHTLFYVLLGCLVAGGKSREKGGERLCAHH